MSLKADLDTLLNLEHRDKIFNDGDYRQLAETSCTIWGWMLQQWKEDRSGFTVPNHAFRTLWYDTSPSHMRSLAVSLSKPMLDLWESMDSNEKETADFMWLFIPRILDKTDWGSNEMREMAEARRLTEGYMLSITPL